VSSITAPLVVARERSAARVATIALAAIVVVSAALRTWAATKHHGPAYFPDEYIYTELSRSLAATGHPDIRGAASHFAPLLAPILTAPAWLAGSVATDYHLAQAIDSLCASLAAVPVYVLARTLRISRVLSLAAAALALALPGLLYTGFMLSEPVAYPLVLATVCTGVRAIDRPSVRRVALFLVFVGLASFARLQFAVLLPCFIVALGLVLARERRLRSTLRTHWRAAAGLAVATAALAAAGPGRSTGYYPSFLHVGFHPTNVLSSLALNSLVLVMGTGLVLVPGALLGAVSAFERPRGRAELAFGALAVTVTLALLLQASIYGDTNLAQTRYTFYLVPLWALAFLLYADRGWPRRRFFALLIVGLVTVTLATPLTTVAFGHGKVHSPELFAIGRLEDLFHGNAGAASSLVVVVLAGVSLVVVAISFVKPRVATIAALVGAAGVMVAFSLGAYSFDARNTTNVRNDFSGPTPSWVDDLHAGPAKMVLTPDDLVADSLEQLFWNRSVDRVVLLPGTAPVDTLPVEHSRILSDGTVLVAGKPLTGAALVDQYGTSVQVRNAVRLGSGPTSTLYRAHGSLAVRLLAIGQYHDQWLASRAVVALWPATSGGRLAGRVVFRVGVPAGAHPVVLRFRTRVSHMSVSLAPGSDRTFSVPVCATGTLTLLVQGTTTGELQDGRLVSVRSLPPRFVADPAACPASPSKSA